MSDSPDVGPPPDLEPRPNRDAGESAPSVSAPDVAPGAAGGTGETELRTFLIADIRGYTTYTRERGDEAAAALAARFAELVGEVVSARDGFLLELRGDEALVVFVSARRALRAAIDLQARFTEANLQRGVGIGLDAGEAIPVGTGFRGTSLNLAARLCAEAGPGEILASEAVIHLAAKLDGIAYVDPRSLRLKGYQDPVRAVAVLPADRAKGHRLASGGGSPRVGRRLLAGVGVMVAVVALLVAAVGGGFIGKGVPTPSGAAVASTQPSPDGSPDPLGGADLPVLAFFDADTGALNATTPLGSPTNISFLDNGSFWILGENPRAMNRIDPDTHEIVQSIPIPVVEGSGYAVGEGAIWMTDGSGPKVVRIDQRTGVQSTFTFGADASDTQPASDLAVGAGSVWLVRPDPGEIVRLDPNDGTVQARIEVDDAYAAAFGEGALWYNGGDRIGRIDPATDATSFEPYVLTSSGLLGNIAFGGGDAWVAEASSGHVWRVDRAGRATSFSLDPGVGELRSTADTMWVTNAETGTLTGIDLVTGRTERQIETGHATLAVTANQDEIMVAVGPTAQERIAALEGSVLTVAVADSPWTNPSPDPALNWNPRVRQMLFYTCVSLLNYPDKPAPDGWTLQPELAAAMPEISPDGRTYTFTIRPGFRFSPPSDEEVTAETMKATLERAVSPVLPDDAPGPALYGDILGVKAYREGTADHVAGLVVTGDKLAITLEAPAPDFPQRLALPFACPVPIGTPVLRTGLDPDPPVSGAGPYYVAAAGRHSGLASRLVILKKNPNYQGPRPQPFDNIAIRTRSATATSIARVRSGELDVAMLDGGETLTSGAGAVATEWGPESANAASGDQRWFGAPSVGVEILVVNPSRPTFRDPDVRRAVSLALDRVAGGAIWVLNPSAELLPPSVPGSAAPELAASPDLEAARALMKGRTLNATMLGFPTAWECGQCRDWENAVVGQLKAIGITVDVRHPDDYPADAFDRDSDVDLLSWGIGADLADPVALLSGLTEISWLGKANLAELDRLGTLSGQERIDGASAFARRISDEQALILPVGYPVEPFFLSERLGCAFVQPAIVTVDILGLCAKDGAASPSPAASP